MTAVWQTHLEAATTKATQTVAASVAYLAQPASLQIVQRCLGLVLALWVLVSLLRALWSFFPEVPPVSAGELINPVISNANETRQAAVDIDALVATHLFGKPGAEPVQLPLGGLSDSGRSPAMSESEAAEALAGIEDGAPTTRLPLILRGVVASSDAGLGQAVIEHRQQQDLYQVGDELPVDNEVVLAKVLPDLVVLDNKGRFEVLRLFESNELSAQVPRGVAAAGPAPAKAPTAVAARDVKAPEDVATIAAQYRDRLYRDPQSLADVVRVTAVRDGTQLLGYRISPGSAAREFSALGFESGDIVTAINGLSLTDPSNTLRLFEDMRSVQEANFELQRKGAVLNLNVNIAQAAVDNQ